MTDLVESVVGTKIQKPKNIPLGASTETMWGGVLFHRNNPTLPFIMINIFFGDISILFLCAC